MKITKSLMLATIAALSLGAGVAMAQESPGGGFANSYEEQQLAAVRLAMINPATGAVVYAAPDRHVTTLFGSSAPTNMSDGSALQGGDGNGR